MTIPAATIARRTGILAAVLLAAGLLASPPARAQSGAAPALPASMMPVPAAPALTGASRPSNGTILYARITGGMGVLTIKNGPGQDGVVTLVLGRSKAISVYVRARSSATVHNIKPGVYAIYFTTGSLFNIAKGRFARGATYWRFDDRVSFVAPPRYTIATLTLYVINGGNAPTSQIGPGQYPA